MQNQIGKKGKRISKNAPNVKRQIKQRACKLPINKIKRDKMRNIILHKFSIKKQGNIQQDKTISPRFIEICLNEQEYNCIICLQLMINPVSLNCGHSFCFQCLSKLNKTEMKDICSLCRAYSPNIFYEVNQKLSKIIQFIIQCKLGQNEKRQYQQRTKQIQKSIQKRGLKRQMKQQEWIQIYLNNSWKRGMITNIYEFGKHKFYQINVYQDNHRYTLSHNSINLAHSQEQIQRLYRKDKPIFSSNVFVEPTRASRAIPHTYNIQQLLWEILYYPPNQPMNHSWQNNIVEQFLPDYEQQSVQFIGRQNNSSNRRIQVIQID